MGDIPMPKLPGFTVEGPKAGYLGKAQTLNYNNGYAMVQAGGVKPLDAPPPLPASDAVGVEGAAMMTTLPAWVAYDRKVLRFYGYFKEAVTESYEENHRVRKCVIYFYLEDESIHVAEPKQENSGIPQGVFIKRHRIPKDSGEAYTVSDFLIGASVTFYGRSFSITSCDPFTRKFMENSGMSVPDDVPMPDEPIELYRSGLVKVRSGGPPKPRDDDLTRFMEAKLGRASNVLEADKLAQFLECDGKVLRFYCLWDDRSKLYGDRRPYVLHYFLADDTIEILEVNEPNSGRDPFPIMLKRAKLPKGETSVDCSGTGMRTSGYVAATDLAIGRLCTVFGRTFFIHDCDAFTRAFCIGALGYDPRDMEAIDVGEPALDVPKNEIAAYNGFGSLEDTKQNCLSLIPKPPKKDFHQLMNNEKKILRFTSKMVDDESSKVTNADKDREFILSYFLADDTISIFEPPARNSGIIGGKFLERGAILKPGTTDKYKPTDCFVGTTLKIFKRSFELTEADVYTLKFMEDHPYNFPYSSWSDVVQRLKTDAGGKDEELRTAFIEMDADGSGYLSMEELNVALDAAGLALNKQQVITLVRKFDKDGNGKISIEEFFAAFGMEFTD